jgi:HemX protein
MLAALSDRQWLWLAAEFYLAGFLLGTWSLLRRGRPSGVAVYSLIAVGYLFQLIGLGLRGRAVGGCPLGNTFELFQFTAWSAISLYVVVGVTFRSSVLGYFTACLTAVLTLVSLAIPAWDAERHVKIFGQNSWIEMHAALALFSYGVFALLALTSLMLLLRHFSLKAKNLGGLFSFLPSMVDLDHIGLRLLTTGVVLLAASLAVGSVYWLRDPASASVPKLLFTIAVWLAYAVALFLRLRGQLLAKRFAWTGLLLFAAALLSLWPVDASRHPAVVPAPNTVPRQQP